MTARESCWPALGSKVSGRVNFSFLEDLIDGKNRLFVSVTGNHRVQLFQLGMAALNMNADSSEGSKTKDGRSRRQR